MIPKKLKTLYKAKIPRKITELQFFIDQSDIENLRFAVHKLQGSSGTYGYMKVSQECAKWEYELMKGSVEQNREHLENIKRFFHE
ncbi:MAG: Hpt domain-containing protein [Chlamydiae bacterium]|nr:Hpt domain-containing protein [Chlamydiota bacterium]